MRPESLALFFSFWFFFPLPSPLPVSLTIDVLSLCDVFSRPSLWRSNSIMAAAAAAKTLEAIQYSRGELRLLDQRRLPLAAEYLDIKTVEEAWKAIRDMVVRGAPAIAITAALALANDLLKQGYLAENSASGWSSTILGP